MARDIAPGTVIILLTGHATVESAIAAVREGAHDYLLKPASIEELLSSVADGLARRRQFLRQKELVADIQESLRQIRGTMQEPPPTQPTHEPADVIRAGPLTIDPTAHEATLHGEPLSLTPIEFSLPTCLAREAGTVLRPEEIVQAVWGHESELWEARSTLNPHLTHLRQKLQPNPDEHQCIVNVRGVGYKFVSPTR